jgi:hypothetical protein
MSERCPGCTWECTWVLHALPGQAAVQCGWVGLTLLGSALPALPRLLSSGGLRGRRGHLGRCLRVGGSDGRAHSHPLRANGAMRLHTARSRSDTKRVRQAAGCCCWRVLPEMQD